MCHPCRFDEAVTVYEEVVATTVTCLGESHPNTAISLTDLASAFRDKVCDCSVAGVRAHTCRHVPTPTNRAPLVDIRATTSEQRRTPRALSRASGAAGVTPC